MKNFVNYVLLAILLVSTQSFAQSTKPTPESLAKLFELTEVRTMIPRLQEQLDGMMNNMTQEILKGKSISPEQQKALDVFRTKVVKIQKDEISWETVEPKITEIYQNTLTQDDVNGIIAFYQTPAGQSFVKKMPEIMQQTMMMMQTTMVPMLKKIEAAGIELKQDLQRIEQK